MLRTSVFLTLSALAFAGTATAQQAAAPAARQAAPQATPPAPAPQAEPIEKGRETPLIPERPAEPATTIRERKQGGVVQEATVTSGGSTYTLRPARPAGNAAAGSVEAGPSRAPTWNVLDFGLAKKKKKPKDGAAEAGEAGQPAEADADAPPPMPGAPVK